MNASTRTSSLCEFPAPLPGEDSADRRFARNRLLRVPHSFAAPLSRQYRETWLQSGKRVANLQLLGATEGLTWTNAALAESDDAIRMQAARRARDCAAVLARSGDPRSAVETLREIAKNRGIKPPEAGGRITVAGVAARLTDERWWRRGLRRYIARDIEALAIKLGMVHPRKARYASDSAVKRRRL